MGCSPERQRTRSHSKTCAICERPFKAARSDARYCGKTCRDNAKVARNRRKTREETLAALGGKCACGSAKALFVRKNGTLTCGKCRSQEANDKFHERWPKGKRGYIKSRKNRKWAQEFLDDLPDDERERFLAQFR